jgi:hypothetical protein
LLALFETLGEAMLVVIGWVLWLAPLGVFALAVGVAARSGGGAIAALGHYILVVSSLGFVVLVAAYGGGGDRRAARAAALRRGGAAGAGGRAVDAELARQPAGDARGVPRARGARDHRRFRAPAGGGDIPRDEPGDEPRGGDLRRQADRRALTPPVIAAGFAVALVTTVGSVSLPGTVSFITSISPIALAMGVPLEPLALLVAVEMLPDLMRTVGNVTMDVAVTATVDRSAQEPG